MLVWCVEQILLSTFSLFALLHVDVCVVMVVFVVVGNWICAGSNGVVARIDIVIGGNWSVAGKGVGFRVAVARNLVVTGGSVVVGRSVVFGRSVVVGRDRQRVEGEAG